MDTNESLKADQKFFDSLSAAELDEAAAIETKIHQILQEGFSEDVGLHFVRTVMVLRKLSPGTTVGGVYDSALRVGLREIVVMLVESKEASPTKKSIGRGHKRGPVRGV